MSVALSAPNHKTPMASKEEILSLAKHRLETARDADKSNREEALDDLRFLLGEQWDETTLTDRTKDGRPSLVFNRLPSQLDHLVGDIRQNKISIKVLPVDDEADPHTADIINGLVRNIEYVSNAELVYTIAAESALSCGLGALRVLTKYENPRSFDQELIIEPIRNPFSVFIDPRSVRPDGSDAKWAAVSVMMDSEEFKQQYPDADIASFEDTQGDRRKWWFEDDGKKIRLMEYYWIEEKPITLHLLSNGLTLCCKKYEEAREELEARGIYSVKTRESKIPTVFYAKMTANGIVEGPQEWPSSYIPIIPVVGKELNIEGEIHRRGAIRNAKVPQQAFNYMRSSQMELLGLQSKAPWILSAKQIEGHEDEWGYANISNLAFLVYNDVENGRPPFRASPPVGSVSLFQEAMQAIDDMKAATHIYDASLGNRSNETSGVAIKQRQRQGERGNYTFFDNYALSIKRVAKILVDMIPRVYDGARVVRIIGSSGEPENVVINEEHATGKVIEGEEETRLYKLDVGKYDVVTSIGPSSSTARQESIELIMDILKLMPNATPVVADVLVKNMTFKDSDELEERLRFMNPYIQQKEQKAQMAQQGPQNMSNPQGGPPGMVPGQPPAPMPTG